MIGARVYPDQEGSLGMAPGEYGQHVSGEWMAVTPNGLLGGLRNHEVTVHEDETITVSPSILVKGYSDTTDSKTEWHGFLERGVWREA